MGYHNVVKGRVGAPEAGETDFDDHVAGLSWAGAIRGTEYGVGGCCGRRKVLAMASLAGCALSLE